MLLLQLAPVIPMQLLPQGRMEQPVSLGDPRNLTCTLDHRPEFAPQSNLRWRCTAYQVEVLGFVLRHAIGVLVLASYPCSGYRASTSFVKKASASIGLDDGLVRIKTALDCFCAVDGHSP